MMNSAVCVSTNSLALGTPGLQSDTPYLPSITGDSYVTVPMAVVGPAALSLDEEKLHSSFEHALSKRTSALQVSLYDLKRLAIRDQTHYARPLERLLVCTSTWQRYVISLGLALSLMLIGFDVMGLLVLHMR